MTPQDPPLGPLTMKKSVFGFINLVTAKMHRCSRMYDLTSIFVEIMAGNHMESNMLRHHICHAIFVYHIRLSRPIAYHLSTTCINLETARHLSRKHISI